MIIWLDGPTGVGKSHVAEGLATRLSCKNAITVDSDKYFIDWLEYLQNNMKLPIGGGYPYDNLYFLRDFKEKLTDMVCNHAELPIVAFPLVHELCQIELLNYFEVKKIPTFHLILVAEKQTIISRIENDPNRESKKQEQIPKVAPQLQYLKNHYPTAMRINTENKSIEDVVNEIMGLDALFYLICFN